MINTLGQRELWGHLILVHMSSEFTYIMGFHRIGSVGHVIITVVDNFFLPLLMSKLECKTSTDWMMISMA